MSRVPERFALPARLLHWLMALMIGAMLFVGVAMVATVTRLHSELLNWHKPMGIAILMLVALRLVVRLRWPPPALPVETPLWQKAAAKASHGLLYGLMLAMPLLGWAMLSAGGYPVQILSSLRLPPIAPHDLRLYGVLHRAHVELAFVLFAVVLLHLAAAMVHALIRRDGVFRSMALRLR